MASSTSPIPELAGRYLYADLCTGELRSIKLAVPSAGDDRPESAPGALTAPQSFGEDASGNLYVTNGNVVDELVGPPSSATSANPTTNPTKCKKKHHAAAAKKHKKKCQKKHRKKKERK